MTLRALCPSTASWRSKKAMGSASGSCREGVGTRLKSGSGVCLYAHERGSAPVSSPLEEPAHSCCSIRTGTHQHALHDKSAKLKMA